LSYIYFLPADLLPVDLLTQIKTRVRGKSKHKNKSKSKRGAQVRFPENPGVSGILAKDNEPIFCFRLRRQAKQDLKLKDY